MKKLMIIALLLLTGLARASGLEPALLERLPDRLDAFQKGKLTRFPEPGLGAALGYGDEQRMAQLTIILFDAGQGPIPSGTGSTILAQYRRMAVDDIHTFERQGHYLGVADQPGTWTLGKVPVLVDRMSYSVVFSENRIIPMNSWLIMVGVADHMLKIRLTAPVVSGVNDEVVQQVGRQVLETLTAR